MARNIRRSIDRHRIQILIEKLADLRERLVELRLLRGRDARIRHRPIRHEAPEKQSLGKAERLRPGEKQLLRFLDFFLPLDFCFVHKLGSLMRFKVSPGLAQSGLCAKLDSDGANARN